MPAGKKSLAKEPRSDCVDCSSSGLAMAPNNGKLGAAGKEPCSWFEIHYLVKEIARQAAAKGKRYDCALGIANGGIIPAKLLAEELGIDAIALIPVRKKQVVASEMPKLDKKKKYMIVDDIYDTGDICNKVARAVKGYDCDFAFCMSRRDQLAGFAGRILNHDRWIVFPWEKEIR